MELFAMRSIMYQLDSNLIVNWLPPTRALVLTTFEAALAVDQESSSDVFPSESSARMKVGSSASISSVFHRVPGFRQKISAATNAFCLSTIAASDDGSLECPTPCGTFNPRSGDRDHDE
jgi:hypothetical protein